MHWCCDPCLMKRTMELKKDTCPVCRAKIECVMPYAKQTAKWTVTPHKQI